MFDLPFTVSYSITNK